LGEIKKNYVQTNCSETIIEKAAMEGVFGRDRQTAYEREIGFLKEQVERRETRSATLRAPVFIFLLEMYDD